jgi:hypothetical protein
MGLADWINAVPLWGMFALSLLLCVASVEAGGALSRAVLRRSTKDPDAPLGSLVGSLLGLLAFTLAFTFSLAANRLDARKQLVLQESNAIGTTYLRAALMPPREGLVIRGLLRDYVALRLTVTKENSAEVSRQCEQIHGRLWAQVKLLAQENVDSELRSLLVAAMNETIDLHQSRKTVALQYRVPSTVWSILYLLVVLGMLALGYQIGMSGVRRLRGAPLLSLAFSLVLLRISDLDRPFEGFLGVSQQPLVDVQASMAADSP